MAGNNGKALSTTANKAISLRARFHARLHRVPRPDAPSSIPKPAPASRLAKLSAARHRLLVLRAPATRPLPAAWSKIRLAFPPDALSQPLPGPGPERPQEHQYAAPPYAGQNCDASPRPPVPVPAFRPQAQYAAWLALRLTHLPSRRVLLGWNCNNR